MNFDGTSDHIRLTPDQGQTIMAWIKKGPGSSGVLHVNPSDYMRLDEVDDGEDEETDE